MKKLFLIGALAMLVTSCANEELVNPNNPMGGKEKVAMQFHAKGANLSKSTPLADEFYDFGVWAYKATAETGVGAAGSLVMQNYMVGYYNETDGVGYKPTGDQNLNGTMWYYEGLGKGDDEKLFTFLPGPVQTTAREALHDNQFLKYWDLTAGLRTYFYAAAPFDATSEKTSFDPSTRTMTFKEMSPVSGNYMYACADYLNSTMADGDKVDLTFHRLGAKIRIGFYTEIKGYDIEVIDYSTTDAGVYFVPAVPGTPYTTGEYTYSGTPKVTFNAGVATVTWADGAVRKSDPFNFALANFHLKNSATPSVVVGTSTNPLVSNYINVVPANTATGKANSGLTLNVSLKFIAKDTKEEILVKGARVHVPALNTAWLPNTLYTYLFRITVKVPGQPTDPTDPDPDPTPDPYLVPIVFENITVEDMNEVNLGPWDINP